MQYMHMHIKTCKCMHAYADVRVYTRARASNFLLLSSLWLDSGWRTPLPSEPLGHQLQVTSNGCLCCPGQPPVVRSQKLLALTPRGDGGALGALSPKGKAKFLKQE